MSVSFTVLWCVKCCFVDRRQLFGETTVIFNLENRDSRYCKSRGIYCLPNIESRMYKVSNIHKINRIKIDDRQSLMKIISN